MKRLALWLLALAVLCVATTPADAGFGYSPSQSVPFTPQGYSPIAWYKSGVGITGSSAASAWSDSSGTGDANKNLAQATGAKQPTINAIDAAYNGKTTLSFLLASSQSLASGTWSSALPEPVTVVWIGQVTEGAISGLFDDAAVEANCSAFVTTTPSVFLSTNGLGSQMSPSNAATATGVLALTSPAIVVAVFNGPSSYLYVNGAPLAGGKLGTTGLTSIILGSLGGALDPMTGKIAEVLVLGTAVNVATVAAIDTYYSGVFGIAVP